MVWLGVLPVEPTVEMAMVSANRLDLSSRPDILFQVFGTNDQPRMLPLAVLKDGHIKPISLDNAGWHRFDEMFFRPGKEYTAYENGKAFGAIKVTRGMWQDDSTQLYSLEGCTSHMPLADVDIESERRQNKFILELLATNAPLPVHNTGPAGRAKVPMMENLIPPGEDRALATKGVLEALDGRAITISTGVSDAPTVITSWLDSASTLAADPTAPVRHIFLIADRKGDMEYHVTYKHTANGPLGSAEFRWFLDHLDLTGDGIDELVLEGWRYGGKTWISILGWQEGEWKEIFHSRPSWCLDPAPARRLAPRGAALSYKSNRDSVSDG
jgi:hypothetical protein